jgi:hypothetical protein
MGMCLTDLQATVIYIKYWIFAIGCCAPRLADHRIRRSNRMGAKPAWPRTLKSGIRDGIGLI